MSHQLKNRYFLLRHGQSKANTGQIVVSHPEKGIKEEYSLTSEGENQVRKSIEQAKNDGILDTRTVIYSSPFSRCKRTAEITKEVLQVHGEISLDERLKERWFGDLDGSHSDSYGVVHQIDIKNPHHTEFNVESLKELEARVLSLIVELEVCYTGKKVLLVSHGDTLLILQLHFLGLSFGNIEMHKNAELRELEVK